MPHRCFFATMRPRRLGRRCWFIGAEASKYPGNAETYNKQCQGWDAGDYPRKLSLRVDLWGFGIEDFKNLAAYLFGFDWGLALKAGWQGRHRLICMALHFRCHLSNYFCSAL